RAGLPAHRHAVLARLAVAARGGDRERGRRLRAAVRQPVARAVVARAAGVLDPARRAGHAGATRLRGVLAARGLGGGPRSRRARDQLRRRPGPPRGRPGARGAARDRPRARTRGRAHAGAHRRADHAGVRAAAVARPRRGRRPRVVRRRRAAPRRPADRARATVLPGGDRLRRPARGSDVTPDIVIIGGGVIGASIAYHLAARGARGVVLLERDAICSGETSKSGGFVQTHWDLLAEVRLIARSREVFASWREQIGGDCGFVRGGYMHVTGPEREPAVRRVHDMLVAEGLPSHWLDPL